MAPLGPPLRPEDVSHLLCRTGFAALPREIDALLGLSRADAVDRLLAGMTTEPTLAPPEVTTALLSLPEAQDEGAALRVLAEESGAEIDKLKPLGRALFARLVERGLSLKGWWMDELVATRSPLTERVVLVLHNHLTSSMKKVKDPRLMYRQQALLRRHVGGSYADLLRGIVDDPAMLLYLDASGSSKEAPNENLARELLELFTLGEGHYREADIKAAARALTGRRVRRLDGKVVEQRRLRDRGPKTFLGTSGDLGPQDLVEVLLAQPRTAVVFVEKLWRELVSDDVDTARTAALAQRFREGGYQMKPLLRALLLDDAFWSDAVRGDLVRSPIDLAVSVARRYGAAAVPAPPASTDAMPPTPGERLALLARRMGQDPFDPPNVKGWPTGKRWVTTSSIVARDKFLLGAARALRDAGKAADDELLDPRTQVK